MKKLYFLLLFGLILSCGDDDAQPDKTVDNFDRKGMLTNWADNIIIPAFEDFAGTTTALNAAGNAFALEPSESNLDKLVTEWESAYLTFQEVSMFEVGAAESLRFTNNMNIYPVDVAGLEANLLNGNYNLELPSEIDRQGFPALDYLLFGVAADRAGILDFYQNDPDAGKYLDYLKALTGRIENLSLQVLNDWKNGFRDNFVNNSGNSATASVDKLVNDYIFYYERHLRAGKVGIPAGVFSGDPLPGNVEAFYRGDFSKTLFIRALDAMQHFFNGQHYNSTVTGESMRAYLEYLQTTKNGENLGKVINDQFEAARTAVANLNDNFAVQVETDNAQMLALHDQLQLNVVNLKVDMLQAFNVSVDYVDADGD